MPMCSQRNIAARSELGESHPERLSIRHSIVGFCSLAARHRVLQHNPQESGPPICALMSVAPWAGGRIRRTELYGMSARAPYSGLMFAVRMTLAHFSVSLARNFPNSPGELGGSTNPPRSTRRALMAESEIAKLISLLSRSITAAGVFFGAPKPSHELAS